MCSFCVSLYPILGYGRYVILDPIDKLTILQFTKSTCHLTYEQIPQNRSSNLRSWTQVNPLFVTLIRLLNARSKCMQQNTFHTRNAALELGSVFIRSPLFTINSCYYRWTASFPLWEIATAYIRQLSHNRQLSPIRWTIPSSWMLSLYIVSSVYY